MAISRFDKFTPRDYNMEWYMPKEFIPDFEAWNTLLANKQTKYDTAVALSQKLPKHLAHRVDLAGQYKQKTDQAINDISSAYTKDITAGDRMLRDYGLNMNRDWQAGGLAYELEQEAADYAKAQEEIGKYYKDAKAEHSANKNLAMYKLQEAAKKDFGYDPNTGLYTRAGIVADTTPFVDIMEEAQKVVKEIKDSGSTTIAPINQAWFMKIKKEGVTEETIRGVAQELLQQPKYAQQLAIEQWDAKRKLTPDQLTQMETDYKTNANAKLDEKAAELLKSTSTEKGAKDLQRELTKQGFYTADIDGKFGDKSKQALNEWLKSRKDNINKTTADNLISQQLVSNYVDPLAKTYARMKEDKDLTFNQQWGIERKIQGQAQNNASFLQTLMRPETGEYLTSPGAARPMDEIGKMTTTAKTTYEDSKKTFNMVVSKSPIAGQNFSAHEVNMITNARMESKTPQEFQSKLASYGVMVQNPQAVYEWYNSPDAISLNNAYRSMSSAGHQLETYTKAQESMLNEYVRSGAGKNLVSDARKAIPQFKDKTDSEIITSLAKGDITLTSSEEADFQGVPGGGGLMLKTSSKKTFLNSFKTKVNEWAKNNPDALPISLRGYSVTATKGPGATLSNDIIKDLQDGRTAGYSYGDMPLEFKNDSGSKVDVKDIDPKTLTIRMTSDAKGVLYYMNGKDKDGNTVSGAATAPKQHNGRLAAMARDMLVNATQSGDKATENLALQIFNNTKGDNALKYAVEDSLMLDDKNAVSLDNVVDPSVTNRLATFSENPYVKGLKVGEEISLGNKTFQKYKVKNETGKDLYMLTMQTSDPKTGKLYYVPIKNESGGVYFDTALDAEMPLVKNEMLSQISVENKTTKFTRPDMTDAQAAAIYQQIANSNSLLNED
jgi:hypothetical protein